MPQRYGPYSEKVAGSSGGDANAKTRAGTAVRGGGQADDAHRNDGRPSPTATPSSIPGKNKRGANSANPSKSGKRKKGGGGY